jgi:hypothetical protein
VKSINLFGPSSSSELPPNDAAVHHPIDKLSQLSSPGAIACFVMLGCFKF